MSQRPRLASEPQRVQHRYGRTAVGVVTLVAIALGLAGCTSGETGKTTPPTRSSGTPAPATDGDSTWAGYHANDSRTGAVAAEGDLDHLATAWSTRLHGSLHNEPVVADGRIVVADESNHISALDPHTGSVLWSRYLGAPLTDVARTAGCGDIDPLGITSTPVVDTKTNVVYVVGEVVDADKGVRHVLEGLDIRSGKVVRAENVDPPLPAGESAIHLLQRASLALGNGRIYVAYGGNDGDCGDYHGWVVGVNETGAAGRVSFAVASDGQGGAIWQAGGAPAIDGVGNLYVTTGNANPDPPRGGPDPKKFTESVVKLTPTLEPIASFKDEVAGGDEDLSTGNPILLPGGDVFAVGKTDVGYILRQSDLTEVAKVSGICGSNPDGGPAYDPSLREVFIPCRAGGIQTVDLGSASGVHATFGARLPGANSAPIIVGHDVWALQYPGGTLSEFDANTGSRVQSLSVGSPVANFATPAAALGLMLVGTTTGVIAFQAR